MIKHPTNTPTGNKKKSSGFKNLVTGIMLTASVLATNLTAAQNKTSPDTTQQKTPPTSIIKTPTTQGFNTILVQDNLNHKQIIEDFCERIMLTYGQEKGIEIIRYHLFQEINNIRKQYGLPPLQQNPILNTTAQEYAEYMFKNNRYKHDSKEGVTFEQRLNNAGYFSDVMGENIDKGFTSISSTIRDRLNEPGHKETLLHKKTNEIGVGFYGGEMNRGKFSEWVGFFVMDVGRKE